MALQARLTITGRVQGVGYRDWAITTAMRLGLTGWVRTRADGAVEVICDPAAYEELSARVEAEERFFPAYRAP